MITGIDHIVIMVSDLEQAARQWGDLGFTVIPGGKHPRGTHNALIAFQDHSYLELIAFWEPDYDAHKWHRFQDSGIGLIDHALASSDLAQEVQDVSARGVAYDGPHPGARSRPDGVELSWRTAQPAGIDDHALPFLIDDVSPRELRVAGGAQAEHSNGVQGVDMLQLVVGDVASASAAYASVVGTEASGSISVGSHTVELLKPASGSDGEARLRDYGAGPFRVRFFGSRSFDVEPGDVDGSRISCIIR
jgi:catechol 2,3-dioxygenase-like lactoylglutathione lyase family enzyme